MAGPRRKPIFVPALAVLALAGCAGQVSGCVSWQSRASGADWIVVQYPQGGEENCWRMAGASVWNEPHSDGIYWADPRTGHIVHIAGAYVRVQVAGGEWDQAARLVGVDLAGCTGGHYRRTPP